MSFDVVRKEVRKGSGTTKCSVLVTRCNLFFCLGLGCQGHSFVPHSAPGSSGFRRVGGCSLSLNPYHGRSFARNDPGNPEEPGASPRHPKPSAAFRFLFGHSVFACSSGETGECVHGAPFFRRFVFLSHDSYGCDKEARVHSFQDCVRATTSKAAPRKGVSSRM